MDGALHVVTTLRDALIMALGGYTSEQMEVVLRRGNVIGDLAMKGKYDCKDALCVAGSVRVLRKMTYELFPTLAEVKGYVRFRREPGVREVEIIKRERERGIRTGVDKVIDETRPQCVLAEASGLEGRT